MTIFSAGELADLFDDSAYGREKYTEPAPSDELVAEVEAELGYRLPVAEALAEEFEKVEEGSLLLDSCQAVRTGPGNVAQPSLFLFVEAF